MYNCQVLFTVLWRFVILDELYSIASTYSYITENTKLEERKREKKRKEEKEKNNRANMKHLQYPIMFSSLTHAYASSDGGRISAVTHSLVQVLCHEST